MSCYQWHECARSLLIFYFWKLSKRTEHENQVISLSICIKTQKLNDRFFGTCHIKNYTHILCWEIIYFRKKNYQWFQTKFSHSYVWALLLIRLRIHKKKPLWEILCHVSIGPFWEPHMSLKSKLLHCVSTKVSVRLERFLDAERGL